MSYSQLDGRSRFRVTSPWGVVLLLWFCGFFNYADRQAVTSVFPLLSKEFNLSKSQLGLLGSAFMLVYAGSAPLAGFVVDKVSRRTLVVSGLAFWSLVCAATGLARNFGQLLFYRAAEGLGESFYFPASMSILADYHGPRTRSRAMSLHQTSVYIGTAGGGLLAGVMGEIWGWQSPFWLLGIIGFLYAGLLGFWIVEPKRGQSDEKPPEADDEFLVPSSSSDFIGNVRQVIRVPAAVVLLAVFAGANFVATAFLTWLTAYIFEKFKLGLGWSSLTSTFFPLASLVGAVCGGILADIAARRT
ncbi:MFS transporter, partial [Singulisphaera rosea]